MGVRIVTDSSSYLPVADHERYGLSVVSLWVHYGGQSYAEAELDWGWFFTQLSSSPDVATTSQAALGDMVAAFEKHVAAGDDVCGVFISSELSSTFEVAMRAREMVVESYPDARIELVDSRSNSIELGYVVRAAARAAESGATLAEVVDVAHAVLPRTKYLFVPHTLEYLRRGGRIGGARAMLASILHILPILTAEEGKTAVFAKVRSKKRALERIVNAIAELAERGNGVEDLVVQYIVDENEGRRLADMLAARLDREVQVLPIGPVIGLHVGPGTVGAAVLTREVLHR